MSEKKEVSTLYAHFKVLYCVTETSTAIRCMLFISVYEMQIYFMPPALVTPTTFFYPTLRPKSQGAVLLRILENILGQSILKRGLKKYLEDFKYKNVDHVDLWEKIQQVCGVKNRNRLTVYIIMIKD